MKPFLGPYGAATVVLFTSQFDSELPKLSDLKRLLQIPDGTFYRSTGIHRESIGYLEQTLKILRSSELNPKIHYYSSLRMSTDYLVTIADLRYSLFAALKYPAQLVAGFNLTTQSMAELETLLQQYHRVCHLRNHCAGWPEVLEGNIETAQELGVTEPSILEADIEAVRRVTENYGLDAIQTCKDALQQWYDIYRWNVAPSGSDTEGDAASESNLQTQPEPVSV